MKAPFTEPDCVPADGWRTAEKVADDVVRFAEAYQRTRDVSPFVMPECVLLAAIELAAKIDGTAEGTIEWLENVVERLKARR